MAAPQHRLHRDRSPAASTDLVPTTTRTRRGLRSRPSTNGPHDCAGPCRREPAHRQAILERNRPRIGQREPLLAGFGIDTGDLELLDGDDAPRGTTLRARALPRHSCPTSTAPTTYIPTPQPSPAHRNQSLNTKYPVRSGWTFRIGRSSTWVPKVLMRVFQGRRVRVYISDLVARAAAAWAGGCRSVVGVGFRSGGWAGGVCFRNRPGGQPNSFLNAWANANSDA
jgi:hypothetical protein